MHVKSNPIIRYKSPTRYDRAPFNAICHVIKDPETPIPTLFVQINKNEEEYSRWVDFGEILKGAHLSHLLDEQRRAQWIEAYLYNTTVDNL